MWWVHLREICKFYDQKAFVFRTKMLHKDEYLFEITFEDTCTLLKAGKYVIKQVHVKILNKHQQRLKDNWI